MDVTLGVNGHARDVANELALTAPEWLRAQLAWWLSESPRFLCFCEHNGPKIAAKFRTANTKEDKRDVHAELEAAWRFLGIPAFDVDYEPEGKKGPDFRVSTQFGNFYAEVKRIRETEATSKFYGCVDRIVAELRKVASSLDFSLMFGPSDVSGKDYAEILQRALGALVAECVVAVRRYEKELELGASASLHPRDFSDLEVTFTRLDKPQDSPTSLLCISYPLFFTQEEARKYGDKICDSLLQIQEGSPNVLVIVTHSDTHSAEQLEIAVARISEQVQAGDDSFFQHKGLEGIQGFTKRFSFLGAVVVISGAIRAGEEPHGGHLVWENVKSPFDVDRNVLDFLRDM